MTVLTNPWINIPAGRVTLPAGGYLTAAQTTEVRPFAIATYPVEERNGRAGSSVAPAWRRRSSTATPIWHPGLVATSGGGMSGSSSLR